MEQFVLGIFQEQLSKFIVDFKKEQVNANLLNGKGEIHNVELNCEFLNETISKISPFVELERVHVSKLSFHVTSWTNLRKAPILVDIEHVTALVVEPLSSYVDRSRRRRIRQIMSGELFQMIRRGLISTRGPYNLFDRILDNLTIEVASVNVSFQPWGAFKTKSKCGPWTPPSWQLTLASIKFQSVNSFGCEASPDECWRHNHHCTRSFLIYKRLEMEYQISIHPHNGEGPIPLVLGRDNKMQVQLAIERRLRDGAILAVQIDTTCPKVEIDLPSKAIGPLAHALAGLKYCLSKDRAFVDPLKSNIELNNYNPYEDDLLIIEDTDEPLNTVTFMANSDSLDMEETLGGEELGNLPVPIEDMSSSSSSEGEGDDRGEGEREGDQNQRRQRRKNTGDISNSVPSKRNQQQQQQQERPPQRASPATSTTPTAASPPTATATTPQPPTPPPPSPTTPATSSFMPPDRPVILLPNGLVVHEKLSISLSVYDTTIRGTYDAASAPTPSSKPSSEVDGYIQCTAKGFIGEAIWPKVDDNDQQQPGKGGYVQISVSYVSIKERYGSRIRTILVGGAQHDSDDDPVENATKARPLLNRDETFPLYEDRSVRPDPLGLRYTFPEQAFGLKTTISFNKKLSSSSSSSKTGGAFEATEEIHVLHEVGVEHFDIVLDSQSWCRALRFAHNEKRNGQGGFDPRWHSGDWTDCLTSNMLVNPSVPLNLEECTQPTKQLFLDQNDFPSSDLFNVTARVKKVELKIPAAILDDVRSCDIMMSFGEAMLIVSSALPRTLGIGNLVNGDDATAAAKGEIDFPNDPSDVAYQLEWEDPSDRQRGIMTSRAISTFRLQLTLRELDVRLVPIIPIYGFHQVAHPDPQRLLEPTELTVILCFEGEPPESSEVNLTKIVFFASVLAHRFDINFDFELASSAVGTLAYHSKVVQSTLATCREILQSSKANKEDTDIDVSEHSNGGVLGEQVKIRNSLRGRKVLVTRQIHQSRETKGLSIAFCLQAAGFSFTLYRQNVPYNGPLRSHTQYNNKGGLLDVKNAHMPLLKLMRFDVNNFEVGVEATFRRKDRRVVLKACVSEVNLSTCDLFRLQQNSTAWVCPNSQAESESNDRSLPDHAGICSDQIAVVNGELVEIFKLGSGSGLKAWKDASNNSVALRIEEQLETEDRAWSFAMDVGKAGKGAALFCHTELIEALILLVFETLLLPAWTKIDVLPSSRTGHESWAFPTGSIGALLLSLVRLPVPKTDFTSLDLPIDPTSGQVPGGLADRLFRELIDKIVPNDVSLILIRYNGSDMLVKVPVMASPATMDCFGLSIERSELLVSYLANGSKAKSGLMNVLGQAGAKWSSIIPNKEAGLQHSLRSCQRLVSCEINQTNGGPTEETLVEPFECGYEYAKSKACLSMNDKVAVANVEKLDQFLACLQNFAGSCQVIIENMSHAVSSIRRSEQAIGEVSETYNKGEEIAKNPVEIACSSSAVAIRSARETFGVAKDEFRALHSKLERALRARDLEIMALTRIVFRKEKERLAAAALVSSAVTGWLRIGSPQHTGQRGMMTCNLWPKWVKLQRSLLIMYPGPSELTPTDIINVTGASLCELTGGTRRRDLKRAFAIVESSGVVHLVVTGTNDEYYRWVQQLMRYAGISGQPDGERGVDDEKSEHSVLDASLSSAVDDDGLYLSSQSPQNQNRSVGRSLTRAVQLAKNTSQAVVDRGRRRRVDSSGTMENISDSLLGSSLDLDNDPRRLVANSFSGDDTDSNVSDGISSGRGQLVGRSLSRAVQVAKATGRATGQIAKVTGQAVADRGRRMRTHSEEGSSSFGSEMPSRQMRTHSEEGTSAFGSEMLSHEKGIVSEGAQPEVPSIEGSPGGNRRQIRMLGQATKNRFAGVGQATKRGFGSALQAARQKGKDVAMNTRMRIGDSGAGNLESLATLPQLNSIEESPDKVSGQETNEELGSNHQKLEMDASWSCSACTFINQFDLVECSMCGTPKPADSNANLAENSELVADVAPSSCEVAESSAIETEGMETKVSLDGQEDVLGCVNYGDDSFSDTSELYEDSVRSDTDELAVRPRMKERLGAAVRSVRSGVTVDKDGQERTSGRFGFRQRRSSNQDDLYGTPNPVKLRNVKINGPLSLSPHPIHGTKPVVPEIPSKRLDGTWMVRVEPVSILKHIPLVPKLQSRESGVAAEDTDSKLKNEEYASGDGLDADSRGPETNESMKAEELNGKASMAEELNIDPSDTQLSSPKEAEIVSKSNQGSLVDEALSLRDEPQHETEPTTVPEKELSETPKTETGQPSSNNPNLNDAQMSSDAINNVCNDMRNDRVDGETIALESVFRVKILKQGLRNESSPSNFDRVSEVTKSLSDILQLHTAISESITFASMPSLELANIDEKRSDVGEAGKSLAVSLGLTTVDAIRITGKILTGLLEVSPVPETESFHRYCAEIVAEFINSMIDSSLPVDGYTMLVDFLSLPSNASSVSHSSFETDNSIKGLANELHDTDERPEELLNDIFSGSRDPFALSAASDTQLLRAENQALLAGHLAAGLSDDVLLSITNSSSSDLGPPSSTRNFQEAMYSALTTVMEERDESHARMVAAGVLHIHEMEQQKKAMRRLSAELDSLKAQRELEHGCSSHCRQGRRVDEKGGMQQDSEAELISLCQQLAGEISARTSASLEVIRLKESRKVERENEASERQALEEELGRTREMLAAERSKLEQSRRESRIWMQSYEEAVKVQQGD